MLHDAGFDMLLEVREAASRARFKSMELEADIHIAKEKARVGDLDGGIELARSIVDHHLRSGGFFWLTTATTALVETLLLRAGEADLNEAQIAVDKLAIEPTDSGSVLHDIWLLRMRALLARARGDDAAYRDLRDRYRDMAKSLGFEGHIEWAEAMP
jgi:adenylate cyclase